ncbi:hypothetical protein [Roseimaritima sediminicola]|uniref:hypothetical protein n=1 Tax=Roseimaritima sediminicola TaxID=2662066 RepID=UPI00129825D9|nr:hypothetical protein [Roseimaritima sediminicola]
MTQQNQRRRRQSLVDTEVQGSLLRKLALHWGVFFLANTLALMIWIRMFEQPESGWGETMLESLRRFLPFYVISLALIPAFIWDTLQLTNRFAGPIMRLRSALSAASEGRSVAPLKFRGGDFWQELADDFNAVVCAKAGSDRSASDSDAS